MIIPYRRYIPKVHHSAFVASTASVIGRVAIAANASVWFGAVLRGDIHRIQVGRGTNIQDNAVLHVETNLPCVVKSHVVVGHQATVHACVVGDGALIGIGARILNRAVIGTEAVVASGAVVLEGTRVPPRSLVVGVPGRVIRKVTAKEIAKIRENATRYAALARWYRENLEPGGDNQGVTLLDDLSGIFG